MFERIKLDRRRVIIIFRSGHTLISPCLPHSHAELDNHLTWIQIKIRYTIKNADWHELSTLKSLKLVWTEWIGYHSESPNWMSSSRCSIHFNSLCSWLTIVCSIMSKFAMAIRHEWKVLQSNSLPSPQEHPGGLNPKWPAMSYSHWWGPWIAAIVCCHW